MGHYRHRCEKVDISGESGVNPGPKRPHSPSRTLVGWDVRRLAEDLGLDIVGSLSRLRDTKTGAKVVHLGYGFFAGDNAGVREGPYHEYRNLAPLGTFHDRSYRDP